MNEIEKRIYTKLDDMAITNLVDYLKYKNSSVSYDIDNKCFIYQTKIITTEEAAHILYTEAMQKRFNTFQQNKQTKPGCYGKLSEDTKLKILNICSKASIEQLINKLNDKQIEQLKFYIVRKYMQ